MFFHAPTRFVKRVLDRKADAREALEIRREEPEETRVLGGLDLERVLEIQHVATLGSLEGGDKLIPVDSGGVHMVRSVEPLSALWFGMVGGVRVPSGFERIMAIWGPSRTTENPRAIKVRMTLALGASTGNLGIRQLRLSRRQMPPTPARRFGTLPRRRFRYGSELRR